MPQRAATSRSALLLLASSRSKMDPRRTSAQAQATSGGVPDATLTAILQGSLGTWGLIM